MNHNPTHHLSQSMSFTPSSLAGSFNFNPDRQKFDEELQVLKKQIRIKEAEFNKEKALLQQQVELLRIQLSESNEREINLKKVNENIMEALQNNPLNSSKSFEIEINEEHPKVAEIIRMLKQDFSISQQKERERNRESEYEIQKENQQLNFRILDLEKQIEFHLRQSEYDQNKYQVLKQKYEIDTRDIESKIRKQQQDIIKRLQLELDTVYADIDRQVIVKLNERLQDHQDNNQVIIKYQKEQQQFLEEQNQMRRKIDGQDKQIELNLDKLKQYEDELHSVKLKNKQYEKKLKEDYDIIKKQNIDYEKRIELLEFQVIQYRKGNPIVQKKAMNTFGVKSRNKAINKENIIGNKSQPTEQLEDDDDEKNKLRRQVSLLRCQLKKLEIDIKDLKVKSQQEINTLKDKLNIERKKRMNIYEDKIDKNNQLLQDLLEKDQTIFTLNRQMAKLQEKVQTFTNGTFRGNTPNHLMTSSLHESIIHNGAFTNSMVDLFPIQNHHAVETSRRLISPLRSLDLTILNKENQSNTNSLSFSMLPIKKEQANQKTSRQTSQKKNPLVVSPKQIKRTRINSVQLNDRGSINNLVGTLNFVKLKSSRDHSIAEVNEDLYKDSVESLQNFKSGMKEMITSSQMTMQKHQSTKVQDYYSMKNNQDDELIETLLKDSKKNKNEIPQNLFLDSLENHSQHSDNEESKNFYDQLQKQSFSTTANAQYQKYQKMRNQTLEKQRAIEIHRENMKKQRSKILEDQVNEDEDCLVNILEHEDTNIDVQRTITHTRQHLSTENLFKESQNTMESLNTFRNQQMQKQLRDLNKLKQASIPLPRPQKQSFQRGAVQKILKLKDNYEKQFVQNNDLQFLTSASKLPPCSSRLNGMRSINKSPSSPDIMHQMSTSSRKKKLEQRQDSCPSPLDEDETVLTLGSGEKLRIKEVNFQNLDHYQNQFKEQRHKFSASIKPISTKNVVKKSNQNESMFGFRSRTNSLISSSCSEIQIKMRFIQPQYERSQQANKKDSNINSMVNHSKIKSVGINYL
ncbi:UNKNOWN [Stylonychia lemnae]|uniref:Uncharacterized protein n=1 Tax=Stylonychia lemnae TaxID=5949 RepID=A0A077ZQ27_STYLE|nr:UNKNOWN [Stylonychia lemnae]|eukprot:CDW72037.1 UNKNOWN [Stylonychia lemnae]